MRKSKSISEGPKDIFINTQVNSPFLAEASLTAIAVSEGSVHVLQYVNPAFCRLFGRSAPEFLGRPFPEVIPEGGAAAAAMLLDRVFRSAEAEYLTDEGTPDGSVSEQAGGVSWHYTVWPLLDQSGHPIGLVTQVSNVAAQVPSANEAYVVMRTANQRLLLAALREGERAETLVLADRAKDEFLAMLAHELRNPLAAIRTGVYIVSQHAGSAGVEIQKECDLVERQIRHLARLLDDLLDVSRITQGKINLRMESIDIIAVVQHAVRTIRPLADARRHELFVETPSEPVWVDADPDRMEQIVVNLLHNAVKYTNPGGRIWLEVETQRSAPDGPSQSAGAHDAVIRVRDTGVGIGPENLLSIFDLFVQTDRSFDRTQGGLGIGLTLVRRIIEMHGGSVIADSAGLGQGSEFVVRLPLGSAVEGSSAFSREPLSPEIHPGTAGMRILVVEDNIDGGAILKDVLEMWDYVVELVLSGEDALRSASNTAPDVIILDIGLPGMSGYEVGMRLRSKPEMDGTLLVGLSGYGREADRARSREAGFDFHFTKPVDLEELRAAIALGRRTEDGGRR